MSTSPEKNSTKNRYEMYKIIIATSCSTVLYSSGDFNKNMRTFALKKGYTINEYGIYKLTAKKEKGTQVKVDTEADIFKVLGLDYIEPKDRLSTVVFK